MNIRPIRLFENSGLSAKYDLEKRFFGRFMSLDLDSNKEIGEAIAIAKDNKDNAKNL